MGGNEKLQNLLGTFAVRLDFCETYFQIGKRMELVIKQLLKQADHCHKLKQPKKFKPIARLAALFICMLHSHRWKILSADHVVSMTNTLAP